jgi:hypothetical protein
MRVHRRGNRWSALAVTATLLAALSCPSEGLAACPNEAVRALEPHAQALVDCRAYEQATAVYKAGADILGGAGTIESSPGGEAVSFFTTLPLPEATAAGEFPTYVARRVGGEALWRTTGVLPPTEPGGESEVRAIDEDLTTAVVAARDPGGERTPMLESILDGGLVPFGQPGIEWGQYDEVVVAAITPGGRDVLFVDEQQLLPQAAPGVSNVYDDREGRIELVGLLPEGAVPAAGTFAGSGESKTAYDEHAISADGKRIYFTDKETGRIYLRRYEGEMATTAPVSGGEANWLDASTDGRYAFYSEGGELFRYDAETATATKLTNPTGGTAQVLGSLGVAESGEAIYYTGSGVQAVSGSVEGRTQTEGAANLYEWRGGETTFVAPLNKAEGDGDRANWITAFEPQVGIPGYKSARVTPDGSALLFSSVVPLTGYENAAGGNCEGTGGACRELFRYQASSQAIACVSCNPAGTPASAGALLQSPSVSQGAPISRAPFLTRNLSSSGGRVLFQTAERLLAGDTNQAMDVYEWEQLGEGSCESTSSTGYTPASGGCLALLSPGDSPNPAYFGDASATGSDVFILTREPLVTQDSDENTDIYDVRMGGGLASQNPHAPAPACSGEACLAVPEASQVSTAPTLSEAFYGPEPQVVTTATPSKPKPLTRAQKLAEALKSCARDKRKQRRLACQREARKRYGSPRSKASRKATQGKGRKS